MQHTRRSEFFSGMKATLPMVIGAIPFGIIFGALAVTGGQPTPANDNMAIRVSALATIGLSALVYAGSSQFVAIQLIKDMASAVVIIAVTLIVNLRHALYSTLLAPYMKHLPHRWLIPLGFWLTDETFVIVNQRYNQPDESPYKHWFYLGSAIIMYVNWCTCAIVGMVAGGAIPNPGQWGLDFAMTVTFLGMLIPMIKTRPILAAVITSSVLSLVTFEMPYKIGLMISVLAGAVVGMILESRMTRSQFPTPEATQEAS